MAETQPYPRDLQVRHSFRWRKVANRYPLRVAEAYGGDIERALRESDEAVAVTVAAWERSHGLTVRDWHAIGEAEGKYDT